MRPLLVAVVLLSPHLFALGGPRQEPNKPKPAEPAKPKTVVTKLTVLVPEDDATLLIEGQKTDQTGTKRPFDSPPLEAGKKYVWKFEVRWEPNNYTKLTRVLSVEFTAGDAVTADLTKAQPDDKAQIRYVPTPPDVVKRMMELAKISKDDVVFEPGCGDARMLTAAVLAGAKRAVGIDLDPERIAEAKETVKKAGVQDKVELRQGDALDIKDLDQASVVLLYMGDDFDLLLRPHLWRQLKVGSRVVSHRFEMGDWKPDQTVDMTGADGDDYKLHVWTITEAVKKRATEAKPADKKPAEKK